jgi:peptidoglycan/xylan/chitin deacetylase (PgdA/CDA1 family)
MERAQKELVRVARNSAVRLLRGVLFQSGLLLRMAQQSKHSVIMMFHGIPKESTEEFHDLLRCLARHFTIVPLETVIDRVSRNGSQKSMILALTFDDGLRNHRTVVYPLLADLRLPATFYVCPGLIERAVTTWTWELWCRIPWLSEANWRELCTMAGIRNSTNRDAVLEWMKTIPFKKRTQVEENIRLRTPGFAFTGAQLELYELMSWADLAGVDPGLINVGSHTMTHCNLPPLNPVELEAELEGSRAALELRLGRPVHDFCYPDGKHSDVVVRAVANVYRSGVTTTCGSVSAGDPPHTLKRIGTNLDLRWVIWLLATHTNPSHRC